MRRGLALVLLCGVMFLSAGCVIGGPTGLSPFSHQAELGEQHIAYGDATGFEAEITGGSLTASGRDSTEVTAKGVVTAQAGSLEAAKKLAEGATIKLVRRGEFIALCLDPPRLLAPHERVDAKIEITIPRQARAKLSTTHGDVRARDIHAPVELHSVHGDIEVSGVAGYLRCGTTHGSIHASELGARARCTTVHGDVTIHNARAALRCSARHGDVTVRIDKDWWYGQHVRLSATHGRTSLRIATGEAH